MKVLKPDWVCHDGKAIFSIDIHPDTSRVATGGQGEGDSGKVVIWNMAPIRDEREEEDDSVPRVLCQMDSHLGCVNCVRWSENGKFLASGGDDKLIMIWQTSRGFGSGKSFGSNVTIVEHWRSVATLRGHSGDVLDLAWSAQDVWLASCSVDNTIIVWNALKFPEQVAVLKGHSGLVKGVAWDPVGRYLASQSDDKSLRVWRTSDWKEETVVTSCFKECGGTTHVLRLNWSPDGHHIVSAHAMNNAGPTAQIIQRTGWGTSLDFVGHRKAITVVRFNPKLLHNKMKLSSEKQQQQYSCCAIGSKDRSVSIWLTSLKRPLVVMHDMFEKSIMDLSWSGTGLELMACSLDGTVAYLAFEESEIGIPMVRSEQVAMLEKVYGKSVLSSKATNATTQIIESAAMLNLQQQQMYREGSISIHSTPSKSSSSILPNGDMPFKPRDKQIETRTSDGRRRITPIFLAPQPDINEAGIPAPYTAKSIAFNTTTESSKIVVEKQDRITLPGMNVSSSSSHSYSQSLHSPPILPPSSTVAGVKSGGGEEKVAVVSSSGGGGDLLKTAGSSAASVSVTPMEVDKPSDTPASVNSALTTTTTTSDKDKPTPTPSSSQTPSSHTDKDQLTSTPLTHLDRQKDEDREKKVGGPLSLKKKQVGRGRPRKVDREALMTAALSHTIPTTAVTTATVMISEQRGERDPDPPHVTPSSHKLLLPVPSVQKSSSKLVDGQTAGETNMTVDVENDLPAGSGHLHRCRCVRAGKVLWEQVLSSRILTVAGSRYITCVACEDKTISIFDAGGKRLLPPLMLGSSVSVISVKGYYVLALTSHGYLYIWNMTTGKAVIQAQSLAPVMSGSERLVNTTLTNEGVPLLTISTGKTFSFAPEIGAWLVVSNNDDRLLVCSDHYRCVPSRLKTFGPLASVQGGGRASRQASQALQASGHLQQSSTVSHLQTQMSTCLVLHSAQEYRFWLETYVRYLVQEGLEERLREVCDELLGPIFSRSRRSSSSSSSSSPVWQPTILGMKKRELLKRLLPTIGANLRWQRLYTEYQDQLETLEPDT